MEDIIIRKAEIEDITNLENIGSKEKYFIVDPELSGFWSDKELKNWILSDNDTILITEHNKEIIGFIMISHHVPTSKATLENIWVKKDFRGKGIARDLLEKGVKNIKIKGATYICGFVKTDNLASEKSLLKNGFRKGYTFSLIHKVLKNDTPRTEVRGILV